MPSDPFREARQRSEIEYEAMLSAAQGEAEARLTARDAAATSIEAKAAEYVAGRHAQTQTAIDQARGQVLTAEQQLELLQQPGRVVEVPFRVDLQTMTQVTDLELIEGAIASAEASGEDEWAMQWKTHLAALNQASQQADPHYDTQVDTGFELKDQISAAADADPRFAGIVGADRRAATEGDLAAVFEAAGVESRDALAAETVELRERLDAAGMPTCGMRRARCRCNSTRRGSSSLPSTIRSQRRSLPSCTGPLPALMMLRRRSQPRSTTMWRRSS